MAGDSQHSKARAADVADRRLSLGRAAEDAAAAHLGRLGYEIVARNVRIAGFEIDLIAYDGPSLVFVEVRSRSDRRHGGPLETVRATKQRRLVRAAAAYLARVRHGDRPARFDVVGVDWRAGTAAVSVVRNAFDGPP
jgi:putative endonuclease